MKVAVVHDWLPMLAGAEKVLEEILHVYPGADVFTLFDFLSDEDKRVFGNSKITASYLNRLPGVKKYYRKLLPFCPQAIEDFDLSEYDLVISSSHTVAKGVITSPSQKHISYVHTPTRYAWDLMHQYLKEDKMDKGLKGLIAKYLLHRFRIWDYRTANGVDCFISNSKFVAKRIWKVYRREAEVIYPPVNTDVFQFSDQKEDFFLTASRMVPYKRIALIAKAFAQLPDQKLVIIGDGPDIEKVRKAAENAPNITIMGFQANAVLKEKMQKARAFVFAAEEDFGIIPVEAQACGTPVIAFGAGGALETVIDYKSHPDKGTGLFFKEPTVSSLVSTIQEFLTIEQNLDYKNCRKNAERFSAQNFRSALSALVDRVYNEKPELQKTGS